MPGSLARLMCRYWLQVAYLLEVVMIAGFSFWGSVFEAAAKLGWVLLAITMFANVIMWSLGDWFIGRSRTSTILKGFFAIVLLGNGRHRCLCVMAVDAGEACFHQARYSGPLLLGLPQVLSVSMPRARSEAAHHFLTVPAHSHFPAPAERPIDLY